MKKICVVIPARNEEKTIGKVIKNIPKIPFFSVSCLVVIDNNTTDNTASAATKADARVINTESRKGLAEAFRTGLKAAVKQNADIVVTIDADAQYLAEDIPRIIAPILTQRADIVLGSRFAGRIECMPLIKKLGNILFTWITRRLVNVPITDAQTGFRAMTKEVAKELRIASDYTYTQEMIIDAAFKGFKIVEIPVFFARRQHGKSRLIPNVYMYMIRVMKTIIRYYIKNLSRAEKHTSVKSSKLLIGRY
jgi:glycosyltransferase involved in cell wall biosynthesis